MGLFRKLFGRNRDKDIGKWKFARSCNTTETLSNQSEAVHRCARDKLNANNHAVAVAAATAAAAEAAIAAAQAAAEVVRLTACGEEGGGLRYLSSGAESWCHRRWAQALAAVRIQSAFRGYLARRALAALKALVKLQALVRGYIVRKQMANILKRMQTLVRLQARTRTHRTHRSESCRPMNASCYEYPNPRHSTSSNPRNIYRGTAQPGHDSNWSVRHWMEANSWDSKEDSVPRTSKHYGGDKILEIDTNWKPPHVKPGQNSYEHSSKMAKQSSSTSRSGEALPAKDVGGLRKCPLSPAESKRSWDSFADLHPSYMANTRSSLAKFRSQSAPRHRMGFQEHGAVQRSLECVDMDAFSDIGFVDHANIRKSFK